METNYLTIQALIERARQDRSQAVGEILTAGWDKCKKLFSATATSQTVVWRILPP